VPLPGPEDWLEGSGEGRVAAEYGHGVQTKIAGRAVTSVGPVTSRLAATAVTLLAPVSRLSASAR